MQLVSLNDTTIDIKSPWRFGKKFVKEDKLNLNQSEINILNKY
jgi:hypothetical protein